MLLKRLPETLLTTRFFPSFVDAGDLHDDLHDL